MGADSRIPYTEHSFNPWIGCSRVSPTCDNCYAEAWDRRFGGGHWGPGAPRRRTRPQTWNQVRRWAREARESGSRPRVFGGTLCDIFDNEVPPEWRQDFWALLRETCEDLDWIIVTSRIGNAWKMLPGDWGDGWPRVCLMATVGTQREADRDLPKLAATPAARRGVSLEPLLERVDLSRHLDVFRCRKGHGVFRRHECLRRHGVLECPRCLPTGTVGQLQPCGPDVVVVGWESGPRARRPEEGWVRALRDQVLAARQGARQGPPWFFYKQRVDQRGRKIETPELDGRRWTEWPP